ncbi:MAG: class B sortase [Lachnospiraceae bacterium]|nr:class B sortase [Lachnospiraceae bacterium]
MLEINGIRFRTEEEYRAALKDQTIIDNLKAVNDINTKAGIIGIYSSLQNVKFHSVIGRNFDDEIFELYQKCKRGEFEETIPTGVKEKRKKTDKKIKVDTIRRETESDRYAKKDFGKKKLNKTDNKTANSEVMDELTLQAVKREIRRQNRKRSLLVIFLVIVSLGCIGYFAKYMLDAKEAESSAQEWAALKDSSVAEFLSVEQVLKKDYSEEIVIPELLDEYKALYNKNKSLIGWIKIEGTKIDYPVMQTVNNDYYLKHNFDQKEDANGCIFLDTNCDIILGNTNYIIYGHHMNSGKMFGSLVKYGNKDFYEKHKYINFDTIYEKGTYEVMYVFRSHIYSADEITFKYYQFIDANSAYEFDSAMEEMASMSLYDTGVTAHFGDRLITLSTCD